MLSGTKIKEAIKSGAIIIDPFNEDQLNPNSYDLQLSDKLLVYDLSEYGYLDPKKENKTEELIIPESGIILRPNFLYLASTVELCGSTKYIPMISGRSSYARLGITIHQTAGYANLGHYFNWTLEISVIHPVKIYKGMKICQVSFDEIQGSKNLFYNGKYLGQRNTEASKAFDEF